MRTPNSSPFILSVVSVLAAVSLYATTSVTVVEGDTLGGLAAEHGVSVAQLVEWNGLDDPDLILAGETIALTSTGDRAASSREHHTISAGETLSVIAARYGASVAVLAEANGLDDPDRIQAGSVLTITTASAATDSAPADPTTGDTEHVVEPGETLFAIAVEYGVSVDAIARANDLESIDLIRAGDRLTLPGEPADDAPEPTSPESDSSDDATAGDSSDDAEDEPATTTTTTVPDPSPTTTTTTVPEPTTTTTTTTTTTVPNTSTAEPATSVSGLEAAFERWSLSYGVPQALLEAITWQASDWQPSITGDDGRLGIGQLTAEQVELIESSLLGVDLDPLDASDGVRLAARYLRYVIDRTHDERDAVIAFRQGLSSFLEDGSSDASARFADGVLDIRDQRG